MDEMKIKSSWARAFVADLIRKFLRNKFECDIGIQLNDLELAVIDGKLKVHVDTDIQIGKEELPKLLK